MPRIKAVQLAFNEALPERLRDYGRDIDAKTINDVLADIAKTESPDTYAKVLKAIADVGRHASFYQGETVTLNDLRPPMDVDAVYAQMDQEIADARKKFSNRAEFEKARDAIWQTYNKRIEADAMKAGLAAGNGLAYAVASGARGKADHFKAMTTTPGLFADANGKLVPLFVRRSYGQGLRPAEWLATTYGARTAVISTKSSTAKGGALSKMMSQAAAPLVVTTKDCGVQNGIDLDVGDKSLRGRVLARPVAGFDAGTVIDRDVINTAKKKGAEAIIARSPLTCQAKEGICARCAGLKPEGVFPKVGESVGTTAANALGEPITQSALNVKHCLKEGTLVRMADFSVRKIEDVKPGEYVLGADTSGNTFPVRVNALWDQGMQDVKRFTYRRGSTKQHLILESTEDHQILSNTKKSSCKEAALNHVLRKLPAGYKGRNVAAVLSQSYTGTHTHHEPLALIIGLMLGDGCRNNGAGAPVLSCADSSLIDDISPSLAASGMRAVKRKRSHDWALIDVTGKAGERDTQTGKILPVFTNPIKRRLKDFGLLHCYAGEKFVPDEVLTSWDTPSVLLLLAGFLASDGSVYRTKDGTVGVSFSSSSKSLLEGVHKLLSLRLCIHASELTRTAKKGDRAHKADLWQFTITRAADLRKLRQHAGAVPGAKGRALLELTDGYVRKSGQIYRCKRNLVEDLGRMQCWDLSVNHPDELFVLANGLIVKNTGGMAASQRTYGGFSWINQFMQSPETFQDKAAVARKAGVVQEIRPAPQGGSYVVQGGEEYYVPPGFNALVKPGQSVEAGDQLAEGLVDPYDVVALRGLGEGRRYYTDRLMKILADSGMPADRRNVEMMARATLDHVRIKDDTDLEGVLPDDVVSYQSMMTRYRPPATAKPVGVDEAVGKYLQQPALHYTIGTALTPRMAERLKSRGYDKVWIDDTPPPFEPEMVRLAAASHNTEDWLAAQNTSYLSKQIKERAIRGQDTNIKENVNFAPRLAYGEGFAKNIEQTGKF